MARKVLITCLKYLDRHNNNHKDSAHAPVAYADVGTDKHGLAKKGGMKADLGTKFCYKADTKKPLQRNGYRGYNKGILFSLSNTRSSDLKRVVHRYTNLPRR